jgi:glycosyltransferase involved in cell wall biosynthesis
MSTASYSPWRPILWPSLVLFGLADCVVTQTEMNRRSLGRLAPWLRTKTRIVRNGVDTDRFLPQPTRGRGAPFRFVCVGTVYRVKNPVRIVEAAGILRARGFSFTLDWVGKTGQGAMESPEYHQARDAVAAHGLQGTVRFLGRSDQMEEVYGRYDALVHVSLQEGIPNAVVEAMACGLPLVVGRVSDLPLIVEEADNGFVCGERDVSSIADAMQHMLEAGDHGREAMGARSRELAVRWFGRGRFLDEYEELYDRLCRPVRTAARPDWRSRS